ncbi:MAG: DNA polymerase III subunit delta [Acidobacteria bacterium]|nr:DNA polymerase III subunit delta [Acidobacteriota bacterium]MYG75986.1 DNA polymerase III subunit delta [Acidobacteriota bacterium]
MAFAEAGFGKIFAALGPVPAEKMVDRLPAPEAGAFYVVGGADSWLRQRTLRRLADHHLGRAPAPFRLRRFDGRAASAEQVVSATRTVSFSGAPVVLIENGLRISQPPASATGLAGVVLELVDRPPGRAVIALEWERSPDRRRKDWKALASSLGDAVAGGGALVLDCDAPPPARMVHWIRRAARERGLNLPEQGAELLFERFGRELRQQVNEIEKLAVYAASEEGGDVTLADMEQVLGGGSVQDRFRFTDALQAGRTETALSSLESLLRDGESPQALMALLYRLVTQIQLAQAHGGDEPLAEALRVPRRVADDLERAARRFRPAELRAMLRQLAEMDLRMKTTRVPDRAALASLALLLGKGSSGTRRRRS